MKILLLSVGDNGGGCYWLADAINKYTEHEARSIRFVQSWINYPFDIFAPTNAELETLFKWADVLHVRDNVSDKWPPIPHKKPVVVTWTGMSYRRAAQAKADKCKARSWLNTVSTPDLVAYTKQGSVEWLPNPREEMPPGNKFAQFTVCHAPTFRDRKGTEEIMKACSGDGIKLLLIEQEPYYTALKRKVKCDVVIDQLGEFAYGYGNNAIEAWACGMPVISGARADKFTAHTMKLFGALPYLFCDGSVKDIVAKIEQLRQPLEYAKWADTGREYFYKYHHTPIVAQKAIELYKRVL